MARADRAPRIALRDWAHAPYDVVWFSTARSYEWLGRPDLGPTIVDLDNLEDVKARLRAELLTDQLQSTGAGSLLRNRLARYQVRLNASDWRRFQRSVAAQVQRVVIASDLDAARSGLPNVSVIPNTYPRPQRPVGNPAAGGPPVLLFQGNLGYPPNIDAAQWLATVIAPLVRAAVPEAEVRLVGRPGANVTELHRPGVVTVVGEVPSMEEELARASVAVVPLRYGSGTRVKILESFAHRVPVVSTTLGAEGLDAEDGVHLLLADDPEEFAAATVRLLGDSLGCAHDWSRRRRRSTWTATTAAWPTRASDVSSRMWRGRAPVRRRPSSSPPRPGRRTPPQPCADPRYPCSGGAQGRPPAPPTPPPALRSRGVGRAIRSPRERRPGGSRGCQWR